MKVQAPIQVFRWTGSCATILTTHSVFIAHAQVCWRSGLKGKALPRQRASQLHSCGRSCSIPNNARPIPLIQKKAPRAGGSALSTAPLHTCVKTIKMLFRWLVEEEIILRNSALRLQNPLGLKRVKVSFTHDHLNALFRAYGLSHPLGFRDSMTP